MKRFLKWLSAYCHIRDKDVCEISKDMGMYDYHDYPDDETGLPYSMINMKCKRCGKEFMI